MHVARLFGQESSPPGEETSPIMCTSDEKNANVTNGIQNESTF